MQIIYLAEISFKNKKVTIVRTLENIERCTATKQCWIIIKKAMVGNVWNIFPCPCPIPSAAWWQSWKWQFTCPVLDSGPWFQGKQSRPYLQIIACVCPNLSGGYVKDGYKVLTQRRKVMGIIWKYCVMNKKIFSLLGQKTTAKTVENATKHLKKIKHQFYTISFRK